MATVDTSKIIAAKEKEVYGTVKAGDIAASKTYLLDNFVSVSSFGIVDRVAELRS